MTDGDYAYCSQHLKNYKICPFFIKGLEANNLLEHTWKQRLEKKVFFISSKSWTLNLKVIFIFERKAISVQVIWCLCF